MPLYQRPDAPVETRVEDLLGRLVLDEKLDMLAGTGWMETGGQQKLGIPPIRMAYGISGVADWSSPATPAAKPANATAFPAGIALAATWDPELVGKVGQAIGQEAIALGRDQILGPAIDINRTPLSGATFTSYGEDPFLTGRMAVPFIRGVQDEGMIATAMHMGMHGLEASSSMLNVVATERTLQEIYLPAMEAAIREGNVWSVMAAPNGINGVWSADNALLLNQELKREWGFRGYVMSAWGSTHSVAGPVNGGTDLEMPGAAALASWQTYLDRKSSGNHGVMGGFLVNDRVAAELSHSAIRQDAVDEMLRRRLRAMFATGMFDRKPSQGAAAKQAADTAAHAALARTAAAGGIVLLKNSGVLPLDAARVHSIAVIGPSAAVARIGGGGPSTVFPKNAVTPLAGIQERAGASLRVDYAPGVGMSGESGSPDIAAAVNLARKSDVAIVLVGNSASLETAGADRTSLGLPEGQDELIAAVAAANRNTVVVVVAGSAVTMSKWAGAANAIAMAWFPGQEGGHAIADVVFGDVNPSGKLPLTFPASLADTSSARFSEVRDNAVEFEEGIFVGYRHFDKNNLQPLFPFGHGLSYTTFEFAGLTVPPRFESSGKFAVSVTLKNSGVRPGAEVVQVYVAESKPRLERPPRELKAFQRVALKPGETSTVKFELDRRSLSYYDPDRHMWIAPAGEYEVMVGASSRDIRARAKFELLSPVQPKSPSASQPPIGKLPARSAPAIAPAKK